MDTDGDMWSEWFDAQSALNDQIDRAINEASKGRGDGFRLALYSSVIETCAETMRTFIPDEALSESEPVSRNEDGS